MWNSIFSSELTSQNFDVFVVQWRRWPVRISQKSDLQSLDTLYLAASWLFRISTCSWLRGTVEVVAGEIVSKDYAVYTYIKNQECLKNQKCLKNSRMSQKSVLQSSNTVNSAASWLSRNFACRVIAWHGVVGSKLLKSHILPATSNPGIGLCVQIFWQDISIVIMGWLRLVGFLKW